MQTKTYCIFSTFYPPNYGGVERYNANLAKALARLGQNVIVVTSAMNNDEGITCQDGVTVMRIPSHFLLHQRFAWPRKGEQLDAIMDKLRQQPIDYVLVNQRFYYTCIFALRFAKEQGLPAITLDHGSAHLTMSNPVIDVFIRAYEHGITKIGQRYPSKYYAVSEKSGEWLGHFDIECKGVLHNAIDADEFVHQSSGRDFRRELSLSPDDFVVVFTGRLVEEKGIMIACEAVTSLVGDGHKNIHFLIAGEGPMTKSIEALGSKNIHLLGRLSPEDISALLSQSQVFCLPTVSEGFSTSMLEAAAHGLGIIVTDTGGARELMPNYEYGIVLTERSVENVKTAIEEFYTDSAFLKGCGNNVSQRVRDSFSWKATAQNLIESFEQY